MFKDKKILVAGGAGFVGANLIKRLLPLGADIRATIHNKPPAITDDRIEYITCDLQEREDCRRIAEGVDYVFMCAAKTFGLGVLVNKPEDLVRESIVMNANVLQACYEYKVKKLLMDFVKEF